MSLTIAYVTARVEPHLEWFLSSLAREAAGDFSMLKVVIVDYHANPFGGSVRQHEARRDYVTERIDEAGIPHEQFDWMAPKSNPWQGKCRQTLRDWFNVANSRNTALCYADGDWIAFVDDLSVLMPGWLGRVAQAAIHPKTITLGRYKKVRELVVEQGAVVSFKVNANGDGKDLGQDARERGVKSLESVQDNCPADWHFGYVVGPVQAYLDVNGWVETETAGLSFEDVPTGINLKKKGYSFRYDPLMYALESEEWHGVGEGMYRSDYGKSPKDKSHAVLEHARQGNGWAKNDFFNNMTLAQLRDHVHMKASNAFPTPKANMREWYTGRLLSDVRLADPYEGPVGGTG